MATPSEARPTRKQKRKPSGSFRAPVGARSAAGRSVPAELERLTRNFESLAAAASFAVRTAATVDDSSRPAAAQTADDASRLASEASRAMADWLTRWGATSGADMPGSGGGSRQTAARRQRRARKAAGRGTAPTEAGLGSDARRATGAAAPAAPGQPKPTAARSHAGPGVVAPVATGGTPDVVMPAAFLFGSQGDGGMTMGAAGNSRGSSDSRMLDSGSGDAPTRRSPASGGSRGGRNPPGGRGVGR